VCLEPMLLEPEGSRRITKNEKTSSEMVISHKIVSGLKRNIRLAAQMALPVKIARNADG
jgi:hypothetical protein